MNSPYYHTLFAFIALNLASCAGAPDKSEPTDGLGIIKSPPVDSGQIDLKVQSPILIDDSEWVLFPLNNSTKETEEKFYASSDYRGFLGYWNIAFYNVKTKASHVLSDQKMMIKSITPPNQPELRDTSRNTHIFYSITVTDHNQNGRLDHDDPTYLFVSDADGEHFRQVSPFDMNVTYWHEMTSAHKVLIQGFQDTDADGDYDEEDAQVSFIYDLDQSHLEPIFDPEFTQTILQLKTKQ
ncbi:MAG: hypothetical protein H6608_12420 [Flavobacteriales bacterium]|nr:hypothetical protein [Flavobacteriales bacterium]